SRGTSRSTGSSSTRTARAGVGAPRLTGVKVGIMLPMSERGGGPPWRAVRKLAVHAGGAGLDSGWLAGPLRHRPDGGEDGGFHEAWTLLAALAEATDRVELAPLVLCASFRSPGLVAKMAVTLDEISRGRLILGVGAGWHDPEYEMFGLPTERKV